MKERMKNGLKKMIGIIAALAIVLGMVGANAVPTMAATGTITITPPENTPSTSTTTYKIYKVFDAESTETTTGSGESAETTRNARYSLVNGKTTVPDVQAQYTARSVTYDASTCNHFLLDTSGNVHYGTERNSSAEGYTELSTANGTTYFKAADPATELDEYTIAAIAAYVKETDLVRTVDTTGTATAQVSDIDDGYYYITTSTGTAVTITTNTPNANVIDKNVVPSLDKRITDVKDNTTSTALDAGSIDNNGKNAIAQVGSYVTYQIRVDFGKGSKNIKLHDKMGTGLRKTSSSTLSVVFYKKSTVVGAPDQVQGEPNTKDWWSYKESAYATSLPADAPPHAVEGAPDNDDTMTLSFKDGINNDADYAVITYTLQVTSDALQIDPATNTAKLTYGDKPNTTEEKQTHVYNANFTVIKQNGSHVGLAGAGFKLTRTVSKDGGQETQYYKVGDNNTIEWVTDANLATEYVSSSDGKLYDFTTEDDGTKTANTTNGEKTFTGLRDGSYTLIESTVPRGYNKASDYTFTVEAASTINNDGSKTDIEEAFTKANLSQSTTIINNQGSILPSTGGIGTTIFYVIGGVIVAGAIVLLIARRRKNA